MLETKRVQFFLTHSVLELCCGITIIIIILFVKLESDKDIKIVHKF